MEPIIIRPPKWKFIFFFLGILLLIVGLFFMLSDKEESGFEKIKLIVILPVMFFVLYISYHLLTKDNKTSLKISNAGIELYSFGKPILLEWAVIERIHYYNKEGVKYTTIRLSSYASLFNQVEPATVKMLTKRTNLAGAVGYVLVIPSLLALEPLELVELSAKIYEAKDVHDFFSLLHYNREKYGGDFLISWVSRDKSAKKFATYLNKVKERCMMENGTKTK